MSEIKETVIVIMPHGPVMVNRDDYEANPDAFGPIAEGAPATAPVEPAAPVPGEITGTGTVTPAPAPVEPVTYAVEQRKKLHFVVDAATGADAVREGIDAAGYASNELAWGAIMALAQGAAKA